MCEKMVTEMKVGDVIYEDEKCRIVVTEVIDTPQGPEIRAKGIQKEEKSE